MEMTILSSGAIVEYKVAKNDCKIVNSYLIKTKAEKYEFIKVLLKKHRQFKVRSLKSYYREWKSHNILYKLHIKRSSTKDTDLNVNEYWWRRLGYFFISIFSIDF